MSKNKSAAKITTRVNPRQGGAAEELKRVEKQAFISCIVGISGVPLAFIGFGMIPGIIGLVLGIKAVRPNGKRPVGAIAAIVAGILSIIIGIPGWLIFYGGVINPHSEFIQNLVNSIVGSQNLIL